jgi:hypothetical protein
MLLPAAAAAQTEPQAGEPETEEAALRQARKPAPPRGFRVSPSLSLAGVYDDNVFSTPRPAQGDRLLRLTPELEASYESTAVGLLGRYRFDAERFDRHPDLDADQARQEGAAEIRYSPSSSLTFDAKGFLFRTNRPGELNVTTGVEVGRIDAQRIASLGAVTRSFGPRTALAAEYAWTQDRIERGPRTETTSLSLALERSASPRAGIGVRYTLRHYGFLTPAAPPVNPARPSRSSLDRHLLTLEWDHRLTRHARIELKAGPRLSAGDGPAAEPELAASLRRSFRSGSEIALSYSQTETTVVGLSRPVTTESIGALISLRSEGPLAFSLSPGLFRTRLSGRLVTVQHVAAEASYRLARWLQLAASHQYGIQRGALEGAGRPVIPHNVSSLRLVAGGEARAGRRAPGEHGDEVQEGARRGKPDRRLEP